MNPQDPLAALHPLREPGLIGLWPLATGWWVLIGLAILLLLVAAVYGAKRYRAAAYRRQALQSLQHLWQTHQDNNDATTFLTATNALLKSVAMRSFNAREVASYSGQTWLDFLHQSMANRQQFATAFGTAAYVESVPELDLQQTREAAEAWIKHHRPTP